MELFCCSVERAADAEYNNGELEVEFSSVFLKFSHYRQLLPRSNMYQKMFKHLCKLTNEPSVNIAFLVCAAYDSVVITVGVTGCFFWQLYVLLGNLTVIREVYVILLSFQANTGIVLYFKYATTTSFHILCN
jgi:hypothetical protein